jgi:stringent starvation protein B
MHEWISDSDCTPQIVVDAGIQGVQVPRAFVQDGKIILNVSWRATANLRMDETAVTFSGRFGGSSMDVFVPIEAVLAIYARETGQGMIFTDEDATPPPEAKGEGGVEAAPAAAKPAKKRPALKVVK